MMAERKIGYRLSAIGYRQPNFVYFSCRLVFYKLSDVSKGVLCPFDSG